MRGDLSAWQFCGLDMQRRYSLFRLKRSIAKVFDDLSDENLAGLLRQRVQPEDAEEEEVFIETKEEEDDANEEWTGWEDWTGHHEETESEIPYEDDAPQPRPTRPAEPPGPPPAYLARFRNLPPLPPPPLPPPASEGGTGSGIASQGKGRSRKGSNYGKGKKGSQAALDSARRFNRRIYKGDGRGGLYVQGGFIDSSGWLNQIIGLNLSTFDSMCYIFTFLPRKHQSR